MGARAGLCAMLGLALAGMAGAEPPRVRVILPTMPLLPLLMLEFEVGDTVSSRLVVVSVESIEASSLTNVASRMVCVSSESTEASAITNVASRLVCVSSESAEASAITNVASRMVCVSSESTDASTITNVASRIVVTEFDRNNLPPPTVSGTIFFSGIDDASRWPQTARVRVERQVDHSLVGEWDRPVDANGRWSMPLAYGDYIVKMHCDGFLDRQRHVFGMDFPDDYVDFWLVNGDCDRDNDVDIDDYDVLAGAYGTFVDDALFNARADLDRDGDVDIDDYDILAGAYGQFGD